MKLLIAIILSALILLPGCAQRTIPYACQSVSQEKMANCVYTFSVLEQNPYYCYSLTNMDQRRTCLHDSAEPAMKTALERASPADRSAIFAPAANEGTQPAQKEEIPTYPQPPPMATVPAQCDSYSGSAKDSCLSSAAITQLDMAACGAITDSEFRKSCISDVARKTKDISSCDTLASPDDANLCRLYARGDEFKG